MNADGYLNIKDFDLEGWERVSKRMEYNKAVSKTLEYALGSSVITGTALIYRNVKSNGEVELKINVRYNLYDKFGDVFGVKIEYGNPYDMIGPSSTRTVFHRTFKSNQEYINFLRNR